MLSAVLAMAVGSASVALLALRGLRGATLWWAALAGGRTETDLASLFVFISSRRLLGLTLAMAVACVLLARALHAPWPLVGLLVFACLALPRLAVRMLGTRRQRALARQLPDALALWAGLLRAGQGTHHALAQVASRQASPLGDELRMVLGQMRLGAAMEAGFAGLCERSGLVDLRLLATLLATHRELGGNLAESLQRLAELLRGRLMMEERVQSLTAQGRMQGVVVGLLPLLLLAVLYAMETEAMSVLHTTWQGWVALAAILVLELTGYLLIRRIVKVQI
jgi:tight adherence protein B